MDAADRQFLVNLLDSPSPSGYEQPVQNVVRQFARSFAPPCEPTGTAT